MIRAGTAVVLCTAMTAMLLGILMHLERQRALRIHLSAGSAAVPKVYFGMHIHRAGTTTAWPPVPFGSWRLWDARVVWPNLEPERDVWDFTSLDKLISLAEQHGVRVVVPLGLSPQWASARPNEPSIYGPGCGAEPLHLDDWDEYVRTVAMRYRGRVDAYEIWNEPNYSLFYTGSVDEMVELTRHADQIIKTVDPTALVVSPSATHGTSGVEWLESLLHRGGGNYVDVIGFHFYSATPEDMARLMVTVRGVMAVEGVGRKQLWDTEATWSKPKPFPSPQLGAAYLARSYILSWAAGVQRVMWYAWDNHGFASIQLTNEQQNMITPAGQAYGSVISWLQGNRITACDSTLEETWTCTLAVRNRTCWIVWNAQSDTVFRVPRPWGVTSSTVLNQRPTQVAPGQDLHLTQIPQILCSSSR